MHCKRPDRPAHRPHHAHRWAALLVSFLVLLASWTHLAAQNAPQAAPVPPPRSSQQRLVVIDQDTAGPGGTDMMSLLVLLEAPKVKVLGITVVAGDGWLSDEVLHALRLVELDGRSDVPVVAGAAAPLVRRRESTSAWERQFGAVAYKGEWTNAPGGPLPAGAPLPEGRPSTHAAAEDAAHFLTRMVRQHPHQVTVYEGGPMTNLALALELDPQFAELSAGLVFMGGAVDPHSSDPEIAAAPHREFNLWFDPEAAHTVLRAHWPRIHCTPVDASIQTQLTSAMFQQISASSALAAQYIAKYSRPTFSYMWDELAAAAWLDPSLITRSSRLFMDVNLDHGPGYGDTEVFTPAEAHDPALQAVRVQLEVDVQRFDQLFVALVTRRNQTIP
jgi:purine nucleosidase